MRAREKGAKRQGGEMATASWTNPLPKGTLRGASPNPARIIKLQINLSVERSTNRVINHRPTRGEKVHA